MTLLEYFWVLAARMSALVSWELPRFKQKWGALDLSLHKPEKTCFGRVAEHLCVVSSPARRQNFRRAACAELFPQPAGVAEPGPGEML